MIPYRLNKYISISSLIIADLVGILISIILAITLREYLSLFIALPYVSYNEYMFLPLIYIVPITIFSFLGIYNRRYDFWHETFLILKGCFLALSIILISTALIKHTDKYSRITLLLTFSLSILVIPFLKSETKKILFKLGIWNKKAKIISENNELKAEILDNYYLGYVRAEDHRYETLFIDGKYENRESLNKIIEKNISKNREIIFTPILSGYDFSNSHIYNIFNSRTNIFTLENKLLKKSNRLIKTIINYSIVILSFPLWILAFLAIFCFVKLEDPKGNVIFKQKRLGIGGKEFYCYKFRTMYTDQSFMNSWLKENPDEVEYYNKYHKYMNDPRITKTGNILRKASLDELPQLINVLCGQMSLVGPRPYMLNEKEKIGSKSSLVLAVKPGITGLWQVSGRSDVDFDTRVNMDVWYVKNWSLWNDIIILFKTIGTVLKRGGAY